MKYRSTRGASVARTFSEAIAEGLAPDGGLFVPEELPRFREQDFDGLESVVDIGARFLAPFLEGDELAVALPAIVAAAFSFPIPLRDLDARTGMLELFHGPTAAFKDFGARFLAECLSRLVPNPPRTILVATSGDTGGAVAAAFHDRPGFEVVILFPDGRVSEAQERQLTCWGGNVRAFPVRGTFDDCQRIVKEAFGDESFRRRRGLSSANSINLGRLLPQAAYFAAAVLWWLRRNRRRPGFVVPSGNLGNALGCFWARECGLPVREVALATNANLAITEYYERGLVPSAPSRPTLANAMDVGSPNNLERLRDLYPDREALRRVSSACSVDDSEIRRTIRAAAYRWGVVLCPHTATAACYHQKLNAAEWILVATAHPAKFRSIVEPLLDDPLEVPLCLRQTGRGQRHEPIGPDLLSLKRAVEP
jgi:threonine synthase